MSPIRHFPEFALLEIQGHASHEADKCHFAYITERLSVGEFECLRDPSIRHLRLAIPIESEQHKQRLLAFMEQPRSEGKIRLKSLFSMSNFLTIKNQRKTRQHHLPVRLYFHRFATSSKTIWDLNKKYQSVNERHIKSTGFEDDLYSLAGDPGQELDCRSEIVLGKIENILDPVISAIASRGIETPYEYFTFLYFVSLMYARCPQSVAAARNLIPDMVRSLDKALYCLSKKRIGVIVPFDDRSIPPEDAFNSVLFCGRLFLSRRSGKGIKPAPYVRKDKKVENEMIRDGLFQPTNMWLNDLLHRPYMGEIASCPAGCSFITSDNPAALMFSNGKIKAFPLSSDHSFIYRGIENSHISPKFTGQLSESEVQEINLDLYDQATERLYSSREDVLQHVAEAAAQRAAARQEDASNNPKKRKVRIHRMREWPR